MRNFSSPYVETANSVIWKGMSRLMDIELGFKIALKVVGN